jgi:hypothetical protein
MLHASAYQHAPVTRLQEALLLQKMQELSDMLPAATASLLSFKPGRADVVGSLQYLMSWGCLLLCLHPSVLAVHKDSHISNFKRWAFACQEACAC